jgi:hypothetical protein
MVLIVVNNYHNGGKILSVGSFLFDTFSLFGYSWENYCIHVSPKFVFWQPPHSEPSALSKKIEITPAQVGLQRSKRLLDLGTAPDED